MTRDGIPSLKRALVLRLHDAQPPKQVLHPFVGIPLDEGPLVWVRDFVEIGDRLRPGVVGRRELLGERRDRLVLSQQVVALRVDRRPVVHISRTPFFARRVKGRTVILALSEQEQHENRGN